MQTAVKIPKATPWEDRYDALEDAMSCVEAVKRAIKGIPEFEGWSDILDDVLGEMKSEFEPLEALAQQEYEEEIAALTRDYYRSVL